MIIYKKIFPKNCFVQKSYYRDINNKDMYVFHISNGILTFTVLPERGMDIGEIFLHEEKISWEKSKEAFLHPDGVNLWEEGGWDKGFYAAVASLGPEVFGTPDETRTPHGTGAYSMADIDTINIFWENNQICISGKVPIKGYGDTPIYEKYVTMRLAAGASTLIREETIKNLTGEVQPLDDGYHIQLAGKYMEKGGRYILPVSVDRMLLRDSAPVENNPKEIYDFTKELNPIRCYQYVPEEVKGLEQIVEVPEYSKELCESGKLTAELIVNNGEDTAAYVVRPLNMFPRSLIAKRAITEPMYSLEPCKTRPNSIKQKAIDGELVYLKPYGVRNSWIMFGVMKDKDAIMKMINAVENAEYHVSDLF